MDADSDAQGVGRGPRVPGRRAGLVIGALLLGAAVFVVWRQREMLGGALASLRDPSPLPVTILLGAVALNVVLSGLVFSLLMSRHGRVGALEMQAVIASATLANYLPLRPGLFGRVAYHRAVNDIPVARSVRVVVEALVLSVVIVAYLALVLVVAARLERSFWAAVIAPAPVLALAGMWPGARIWCWAGLCRYAEVLVWGVRYHCAFQILGAPIEPQVSIAIACVSVIATMVPLVSNGLGLREWAVGMAAPLLSPRALELGIAAELVNRAAEVVVVVLLGCAGWVYLSSRRR